MRANSQLETAKLVAGERAQWRDQKRLRSGSLNDFQKLADETFLELRRKYFSPADLIAELKRTTVAVKKAGRDRKR
jgi:hypothetical protein